MSSSIWEVTSQGDFYKWANSWDSMQLSWLELGTPETVFFFLQWGQMDKQEGLHSSLSYVWLAIVFKVFPSLFSIYQGYTNFQNTFEIINNTADTPISTGFRCWGDEYTSTFQFFYTYPEVLYFGFSLDVSTVQNAKMVG